MRFVILDPFTWHNPSYNYMVVSDEELTRTVAGFGNAAKGNPCTTREAAVRERDRCEQELG